MDQTLSELLTSNRVDTRNVPLANLAQQGVDESAIRQAVPALSENENVAVAAFASSI